ncbi:putative response regulator [Aspergillus clavatus NRRL 1]|uniref:Response regulator, putative n=1 Tax=Aspergillus clavatus (strain ATCC 1007 / CBS 513.65 / DSM 816 / NCTC 3887 / NRRL 1 / QM 1276 / 107) TaxID=344612 RepID=A1CAL8_ASPCL|nr:response regulator, putative [Aspergillus clavatus NRRL 1]EAW12786.1 response regulator, putative [Aspergillus clavatus NRRL 1]
MPDRRLSQLLKAKLLWRTSTSPTPTTTTTNTTTTKTTAHPPPTTSPSPSPRQKHKPVHLKRKAAATDPRVDPNPANSTSDLSCSLPPHLLTPDEPDADAKRRAYSVVSSLPLDPPSSPEEIAGPATGSSTGREQYFTTHFDRHHKEPHDDPIQQSPTVARTVSRKPIEARKDKTKSQAQSQHKKKEPGGEEVNKKEKEKEEAKINDDRVRNDPDFLPPNLTPKSNLASSPPPTSAGDDLLLLPSPSATPLPPSTTSVGPVGAVSLQPTYRPAWERPSATPFDSQLTPSLDAVAENIAGEAAHQYFPSSPSSPIPKRPSIGVRRQSLLPASHQHLISGLLGLGSSQTGAPSNGRIATVSNEMLPRKIWVKRPGGSATLVPTLDDSLVDELRDQVIMKYSNSLGKTFDSPDIVIRIAPREGSNRQSTPERVLSPEEPLGVVIDSYYPGGQSVDEALIIDIPQRRTPKPSPRHNVYYHHSEPGEHGEYFPLMPANPGVPTPPGHGSASSSVNTHTAPAISILTTGMAPPLPSPGSRGNRHSRRPPLTRHTTNSPTMLGTPPNPKDSVIPAGPQPPPTAPSIPTPPVPPPESPQSKSHTPPARVASPRPRPSAKSKKSKKGSVSQSLNAAFGGLIEGTVPPINVLIVEDNIINQKLLEAFMKRLSVRWKCAANGEEAVKKWRQGGFHLVLMDIQLPVMNGLDATKEIRRLERLNSIGVFPKTASGRSSASSLTAETYQASEGTLKEEDVLHDLSLFKSPVIIVALTASSLQSDRHEALAAGCNDFLTKPVGFPWLEQKVTEWGCMQALIDFEGWRKWRGFADEPQSSSPPIDSHTSPLHIGANGVSRKTSTASSATSPTTRKIDAGPGEIKRKPLLPELAKPADLLPEEPSGSGSGESNETLDSPASPLALPVGDAGEPSGDIGPHVPLNAS